MAKRLYSLMLNDEVVRAVDEQAHRRGTNRSALIDDVLAEYFGVATAQRKMNEIFNEIDAFFSASDELIPFFLPQSGTFYLKSALSYKYRPTLKYELILDTAASDKLGDITVGFRTQSESLLNALTHFFRLWVNIESCVLGKAPEARARYTLSPGKFTRSITLPRHGDYTPAQIAAAVSEYVDFFDSALKAYIAGEQSEEALTEAYLSHFEKFKIIL